MKARLLPGASLLCALLALCGAHAPQSPAPRHVGSITIVGPHAPLLPNSRFPINIRGATGPVHLALIGPGRLDGNTYVAPNVSVAQPVTVLAADNDAAGRIDFSLAPWPRGVDLIAVACYDDGIALHRAGDFALLGVLALDGGVADVAELNGTLVAPSTTASVLWAVDLSTGEPRQIADVPTGNEVAAFGGDAFVTNRDIAGDGALTRVRDGVVTRVRTGVTAEGLAIDPARALAYVANVNDPSLAAIDVSSMRVVRRIAAPERAFALSIDHSAQRIDVVSNVPKTGGRPGGAVESIDLGSGHVVARSAALHFPVGIALDENRRRLFVTDEADANVAVLDARSLRPLHRPLRACRTPWRPLVDAARRRLYVPCAGANALAVFDLGTLQPVRGSPFPTGGYPLALAAVGSVHEASRAPAPGR